MYIKFSVPLNILLFVIAIIVESGRCQGALMIPPEKRPLLHLNPDIQGGMLYITISIYTMVLLSL